MEHYKFPTNLNGRTDLPKNLRSIFQDVDELIAGNLSELIYHALSISPNLIIVCENDERYGGNINERGGMDAAVDEGYLDKQYTY